MSDEYPITNLANIDLNLYKVGRKPRKRKTTYPWGKCLEIGDSFTIPANQILWRNFRVTLYIQNKRNPSAMFEGYPMPDGTIIVKRIA